MKDGEASDIDQIEIEPRHVDVGHVSQTCVTDREPPDGWCGEDGFPGDTFWFLNIVLALVLSFDDGDFGFVDMWMLTGKVCSIPIPQKRNHKAEQSGSIERCLPAIVHHDPGGDGRCEG